MISMASESVSTAPSGQDSDRMKAWEIRWEQGYTGFHKPSVHKMLEKHVSKLNPAGNLKKIFVPLCGKSVDMKWLADQSIVTVGVEGVQQAVEEFFTENGLERIESSITGLGPGGKLHQSKDSKNKIYCGDMMQFSTAFEGSFDAVWDRGSMVALNREDIPSYTQILKDLMSKGGRILVEVMEYEQEIMKSLDENHRPPPPHAMFQPQIKELFEPQCAVEKIDQDIIKFPGEIDVTVVYYLIVKQ